MTPAEARAAAITLFVTEWANRTPIDHDDDNRPTPTVPYVSIVMAHAGSIPQSWGEMVAWQRFGNIVIQVLTPGGQGTAGADALVQAAVRILEGKTLGTGGALRLGAASVMDLRRDDFGNRHTRITIPFEYEDSHA